MVVNANMQLLLTKQLLQTGAGMGEMRENLMGRKHDANCVNSLRNCNSQGVAMSVMVYVRKDK